MIAAVCWVPRGAAKTPVSVEPPSKEEIEELLRVRGISSSDVEESAEEASEEDEDEEKMEVEVDDARAQALGAAKSLGANVTDKSVSDGLAELNLDAYDEEDDEIKIFGNGGVGSVYYKNGEEDPYITNKDDESDEDDNDDMTIRSSDLLILTARNEDEVSHLEVWVYEEEEKPNMYVHHDIMLPAFPLSIAWLDCNLKGGDKGNFVAVGSMRPEIEIWDLDVLDEVEPHVALGGYEEGAETKTKDKKKKKKKASLKEGSHGNAVLGLAWNFEYRNALASASADHSAKVWDIVAGKCLYTLNCHSDKVQSLAWKPDSWNSLITGSFDRTVCLTDAKAPSRPQFRWQIAADVETLAWNPHSPDCFVVSMENGAVQGFDVRNASTSIFTLQAHDKAVTSVSYNLAVPNLLATASTDKKVKLWDLTDCKPSFITSTKKKTGGIFSAVFSKDSPFLLALGGSKGDLEVWNILDDPQISSNYAGRT